MATGTDYKILKRLEEWEAEKGLPESLELYRRLLRIESEVKSRIGVPELSLNKEASSNRIACGSPLLSFTDLSIDWSVLASTFGEIVALLTSYPELWGEVPQKLKAPDPHLLKETARVWFEDGQLPPETIDGTNGTLLEFVLHAALRPFLVSHSETLLGRVNQEQWRRGYCPVCRGDADFAFLDREAGARWLLCFRCDARWLFQRLECPYCGNRDQNTLAYFTDDQGLYRLYVCEQCHRYLKAIDLRRSAGEALLPLERFLTLDLDAQAQKGGYSPGAKAKRGGERQRE